MVHAVSYKLFFLGHRNLIKNITQTVMINIVFPAHFNSEPDVSHDSQHTISKVTVTNFSVENIRGLEQAGIPRPLMLMRFNAPYE